MIGQTVRNWNALAEEQRAGVRRKNTRKLVIRLVVIAKVLAAFGQTQPASALTTSLLPTHNESRLRHCTVVTVSRGGRAFFGGNDDYINFDITYWVDPGSAAAYGAIYFGEPDNVQQGFNEKGLAYDANGLPESPVTSHAGNKPVDGGYTSYPIQILRECASVEEVIAWVQEHRWHTVMRDQLHFGDATGDAVVISAAPDGKVAFTRKPPGDSFLVSTNFNVANTSNRDYLCWRYSRATELLSHIIERRDELTVEHVASVMDAVHVESASGWTLNTLVADLQRRLVYVYFMFQYDAPIVLNVDDEIAREPDPGRLSELFPSETVSRAKRAHQRLLSRSYAWDVAALSWLGFVCASLVAFVVIPWCGRRSTLRPLVLWIPAVAVLGPIGLFVWLMAGRCRLEDAEADARTWRRALVEVVGDLPPCVVGLVAAILAVILIPAIGGGSPLQLLVIYGLPLFGGLLLMHAPLLAVATRNGYRRTVIRRLPIALVSTNLALAGLLATTVPLIAWCVNLSGRGALIMVRLWAVAIPGALVGGLLLYAYHAWAVRRDFAGWSALLRNPGDNRDSETQASSPSWRRLWIWVPVSFIVLVAGLALGALGEQAIANPG